MKQRPCEKYIVHTKFVSTMITSRIALIRVQYCGPGTMLDERLAREDPSKNPFDAVCEKHDNADRQHPYGLSTCHRTDNQLSKLPRKDSNLRTLTFLREFLLG